MKDRTNNMKHLQKLFKILKRFKVLHISMIQNNVLVTTVSLKLNVPVEYKPVSFTSY